MPAHVLYIPFFPPISPPPFQNLTSPPVLLFPLSFPPCAIEGGRANGHALAHAHSNAPLRSCCTISRDDAAANANAAADAGAGTVATVTANTAAANRARAKAGGLVGLADPDGSKREGSEAAATSAAAAAAAGAATLERGAKDQHSVAAAQAAVQAAVQAAHAEWPDRLLESWSSRAEDEGERWWRKAPPQWGEVLWSHCSARNGVCADTTASGGGGGGGKSIYEVAPENPTSAAGGSASGELLIDAVLAACNAACNAGGRERKLSAGERTGEPQAARRAGAAVAGGASVPANSAAALAVSASASAAGAAAAFPGMIPSLTEEIEACVARRELAETAAEAAEAAEAAGRPPQQPFVSSSLAEVAAALERESDGPGSHGCGIGGGGGGGDVRPATMAEGGGTAGRGGKRRRWCDVALALGGNGVNSGGAATAAPVGAAADLWGWGSEKLGQQQRAASLERPPMGAPEQPCFSSLFPVPVPSRRAQLPRARTSAFAAEAAAGLRSGRGRGVAMAAASEKENKRIAAAALQWQLQQEKQQQEKQQEAKVLPGMPATLGVQSVLPAAPRAPTESTAPAAAAAPERVWRIDGRNYFPLWNDQQQQGVRRHKRFRLVVHRGHVNEGYNLFRAVTTPPLPHHPLCLHSSASPVLLRLLLHLSSPFSAQDFFYSFLVPLRRLTTAAATASALSCSADPACSSTTTSSSSIMTIICVVVVAATVTASAIVLHLPMEAFPCLPHVRAIRRFPCPCAVHAHYMSVNLYAASVTVTYTGCERLLWVGRRQGGEGAL
ncbi:unnamed protein product [Closterium sp. NIES-65]|nr:unnamed protein product [Closterium sp. NIES-65]